MSAVLVFLFIAPVVIALWMLVWVAYRIFRKMIEEGDL